MNIKKFISFTILLSLLTNCATLIKGTSDTVSINSVEDGTTIYVNNVARGKNSTVVQMDRGETYFIKAEKKGCKDVTVNTSDSFEPITLLGLLLGFGALVALPVDFISGAAWKTDPHTYTVTPVCK